jgi:hypothetical protein
MMTKRNFSTWLFAAATLAAFLCLAAPLSRAQKAADAMAEDRQGFRASVLAIKGSRGWGSRSRRRGTTRRR